MRQTHAEIDTQIIDTAAWMFATHGFDRTSVQQIADAVGYSKTGLLHRFPSKISLRDAADQLIATAIDDIFTFYETVAGAPDERRRLLGKIAEIAEQHPGLVQYLLQGLHAVPTEVDPVLEDLKCVADRLIRILIGPDGDETAQFRAVLAMEMICSGILIARTPERPWRAPDLQPLLVRIAESVIDTR